MPGYKDKINIGFEKTTKDGIEFYRVPSFCAYVDYLFCAGGEGLRFKVIRGATREDVLQSYQRVCERAGLSYQKLIMTNIVHGDAILLVGKEQEGIGVFRQEELPPCDGLIVQEPGIPIASTHADCTPIVYYDREKDIGCVVHAGWRGVLAEIQTKAIQQMESMGCKKENLLVAVGPLICQEHFEVGKDVGERFAHKWESAVEQGTEKDHVDLLSILLSDFERVGILPEQVTIDGRCTYECEKLQSFRRDGKKTRTMVQILSLRG